MVNSIIQAKWCHEFRCHQNTRARDRIISFSQSRAELKGSSSHYKVKQRWLRSYDDSNYITQQTNKQKNYIQNIYESINTLDSSPHQCHFFSGSDAMSRR